jgi:hypothetical protein
MKQYKQTTSSSSTIAQEKKTIPLRRVQCPPAGNTCTPLPCPLRWPEHHASYTSGEKHTEDSRTNRCEHVYVCTLSCTRTQSLTHSRSWTGVVRRASVNSSLPNKPRICLSQCCAANAKDVNGREPRIDFGYLQREDATPAEQQNGQSRAPDVPRTTDRHTCERTTKLVQTCGRTQH